MVFFILATKNTTCGIFNNCQPLEKMSERWVLSIGLRVLCLVEFTVRKALQEQDEKLNGIYAGNPKRATARPTTEMMLRAFVGISLVIVSFGGINHHSVSPLNVLQLRILALLGSSSAIYQGLAVKSGEVGRKIGEPWVLKSIYCLSNHAFLVGWGLFVY